SFLTSTTNTQDTMGHGTATAGTAAAITNNGMGVAGIAWQNPLLPLVVVDATGSASYSDMASAITYAADHGARIVNISIGGASSSSTLQSAVNYAWNKGAVVFASAGNGGSNAPYYPAACQYAVGVSATDSTDTLASFSSYGPDVSLSAPGVNILTTTTGGGYGYWSGTSFSSPVAAGVGALVLSYAPSMSAQALVNVLEQNSDDLGAPGYDQYYGWGRVNAYKALLGTGSSGDTTPPAVTLSSPSNGAAVNGSIAVQGTATDNVGVSRIEFFVDGNLAAATAYSSPFSFPWNTTSAANATHTLTVNAYDAANNVGQASVSVTVNNAPPPPDTQPPTVYISSPANGQQVRGNSIAIMAIASDNVGVTQVSISIDGVVHYTGSVAPYSLNYNTKKLAAGPHTVTAKAWDAVGNWAASAPVTFVK
ncbi:MAG: S8 family serine peptidase, partial [Bryobacteraceae bacterium]